MSEIPGTRVGEPVAAAVPSLLHQELTGRDAAARSHLYNGDTATALELWGTNLAAAVRGAGPASYEAAVARATYAEELAAAGQEASAIPLWDEVVAWWASQLAPYRHEAVRYRWRALEVRFALGRYDEVVALGPAALAACEAADTDRGHLDLLTIRTRNLIARANSELGHRHRAMLLFRDNLVPAQRVLGEQAPELWLLRSNYAMTLYDAGDVQRAFPLLTQARTWFRCHEDPDGVGSSLASYLGAYYDASDDTEQAIAHFRDAAACGRREGRAATVWLPWLATAAALERERVGIGADVECYRDLLRTAEEALGGHHPLTLDAGFEYAHSLWRSGAEDEAVTRMEEIVRVAADVPDAAPTLYAAREHVSTALAVAGDVERALRIASDNVSEAPRRFGVGSPYVAQAREHHARLLSALGRLDDAVAVREAWLEEHEAVSVVSPEAHQARLALSRAYWRAERQGDALSLWRRILTEAESQPGDGAADAVEARATVVAACEALGRYDDAARLLEAQLRAATRAPTPDPTLIERTGADLGHALVRAGHMGEAVPHLEHAAEAAERRWGDVDPRTIRLRAAAAVAVGRAGDRRAGHARLAALLERVEQSCAGLEVHAAVAAATCEAERALGQLEAAERHARCVVDILARWRPPEDPDVLAARLNLAEIAAALGHDDAAAAQLHIVRAGRDDGQADAAGRLLRRLGRSPSECDDPDPITHDDQAARRTYAYACRDFGPHSDAADLARLALGNAMLGLGRLREAEEHFRGAAGRRGSREHSPGFNTVAARNRAAIARERRLGYEAGVGEFRAILTEASAELGPDDPFTQAVRSNLADSLDRSGDIVGAQWHFGHNIASLTRSDGDRTERTLDARRRLAYLLLSQGRPYAAMRAAQRVVDDAEATFPPGHVAVLDARNMLGMAYDHGGLDDEARELYESNLVEGEAALGPDAPPLLPFRMNLATWYAAHDMADEASTMLRVSSDQADRTLLETDPERADIHRRCADLYETLGQRASARRHYEIAQEVADGVHPGTTQARDIARERLRLERKDGAEAPVVNSEDLATVRDAALWAALGGDYRGATALTRALLLPELLDGIEEVDKLRDRISPRAPSLSAETLVDVAGQLGWGDPSIWPAVAALESNLTSAQVDALATTILGQARGDAHILGVAAYWAVDRRRQLLARAGAWSEAGAVIAGWVQAVAAAADPTDPRVVEAYRYAAGFLQTVGEFDSAMALLRRAGALAAVSSSPDLRATLAMEAAACVRVRARLGVSAPE